MIASIQGIVASTHVDHVVVVVSGMGFKVYAPFSALAHPVGDEIFLHTILIVREDALTLYGFPTLSEREVFERLITVSGVGPRSALAILSTLSIDHLRSAVASGQPEMLTRVPGIGKKTAEKIVFELKDKFKGVDGLIAVGAFDTTDQDVLDALVALGYSIAEAQAAIAAIKPGSAESFEERMRLALQYFV